MDWVVWIEEPLILTFDNMKEYILSTMILKPVPETFDWSVICTFQRNKGGIASDTDVWGICFSMAGKYSNVSPLMFLRNKKPMYFKPFIIANMCPVSEPPSTVICWGIAGNTGSDKLVKSTSCM